MTILFGQDSKWVKSIITMMQASKTDGRYNLETEEERNDDCG